MSITELITDSSFVLQTEGSDILEFTVPGLHPFYRYDITVAAFTVEQGPWSNIVTLETFEDGEFVKKMSTSDCTHNN